MLNRIINSFNELVPCQINISKDQVDILSKMISFSNENGFIISENYNSAFYEAVNQKLDLNREVYQKLLDCAFENSIILNYSQKKAIRFFLDSSDKDGFIRFLYDNNIFSEKLVDFFTPFSRLESNEILKSLIERDSKFLDVLSSIFSRYSFNLFEKRCTQMFFSGEINNQTDYFSFLNTKYPGICDRSHAMAFFNVSEEMFLDSYEAGCNMLLSAIKNCFSMLNNHCELLVYIPFMSKHLGYQWRVYSDLILYAEKHIKEKIDKTYFRWKRIADITKSYVNGIIPYYAEFEYAFQGFVFKDCFVIKKQKSYDLLLVFEKNVRDERVINCPACYSKNVQGNSYPILNVRSWECQNPLCSDRSKYNRGKRYAFMSLFRQMKLQDERNRIPFQSISKWRLDCVDDVEENDLIEMALRHYSCYGDSVDFYSMSHSNQEEAIKLGRTVHHITYEYSNINELDNFKNSSYFYRYLQIDDSYEQYCSSEIGKATLYRGDALSVLRDMKESSIDGVVTSPPYYNAKTYSQWGNIYCYLFDMYNISRELYRVMKEGGVYLFNIFDYFDNENNIALSAMGNKRMILGAYMFDIFHRIGFNIVGNIIWNKGEIQGNRSFNQGNLTPYYQSPLNCWEHIMILSKGKINSKYVNIVSHVEKIKPVIKMVKGKNILGHDAPFPEDIPKLLIEKMEKTDVVLDPFLGSGTTSIVANRMGIKSIGIEKNRDFYSLAQSRVNALL